MKLLTENKKSKLNDTPTFFLQLAPHSLSGVNHCKFSTPECRKHCIFYSGFGRFDNVQNARINRTHWFNNDCNSFMLALCKEIDKLQRKHKKIAIRLNTFSDISWESVRNNNGKNIFDLFPAVQFYDYTKDFTRFYKQLPSNYYLTYSYSGTRRSELEAKKILLLGGTVSVIFDSLPATYWNFPVVSGDEHDQIYKHGQGVILGLTPKGTLKHNDSNFIRRAA